jgi:hypothetical protein
MELCTSDGEGTLTNHLVFELDQDVVVLHNYYGLFTIEEIFQDRYSEFVEVHGSTIAT